MRTKIVISSIGAAALALAISPVTTAQTEPTQRPAETTAQSQNENARLRVVTGEVVEVSPQLLTIMSDDGKRMTFASNDDLTTRDEPVVEGDRVRIEYRGDAELEAAKVTIVPKGSEEALSARAVRGVDDGDEIDDGDEVAEEVGEAAESVESAAQNAANEVEEAVDDDDGIDDDGEAVEPVPVNPQQRSQTAEATNNELPETAGPLPALVLAGLALVGGGVGLSSRRRH